MIQCFCNFNEYLAGPLILRVSETLTLNRLLVNSDRPPDVHLALMITENTFVTTYGQVPLLVYLIK